MTGDDAKKEPEDDIAAGDATEENIVLDTAVEGFADTIVAANVDALVAKIDETDSEEAARMRKVRKRLEELSEQESVDLDSTFNFNINEKL